MVELAKPGDPLAVGTKGFVAPISLETDTELVEITRSREILPNFLNFVPTKEISIDQLPEKDQKEQLAIAAMVSARLMGLSEVDIADMFGVSLAEITKLSKKPATQLTFERMFLALINTNADNIQGRIASYANTAVTTVVELMEDAETRSDVRLKAAQDILDRSGANPEQFFAQNQAAGRQEDELIITMMEEGQEKEKVRVEIKRK